MIKETINGHLVEFYPETHKYKIDGKNFPSPTQILNILDKPAIKFWAVNQTIKYIQDRLDVLTRGEIKLEDFNVNEILFGAKREHEKQKEEAGNIGKQTHGFISQFHKAEIKKEKFILPELLDEKIIRAFRRFEEWIKMSNFQVEETEKIVISVPKKYAGTLDAIGKMNDKRVLLDYKTSNGIWDEYHYQACAYRYAYEEMTGKRIDEIWILRFGKDGDFEAEEVKNYQARINAFFRMIDIYYDLALLKAERQLEKAQLKVE